MSSSARAKGPEKWTLGKPATAEYYYDEPIPDIGRGLDKREEDDDELFPPLGLDLSDAWVVTIMKSNLTGRERKEAYPAVFSRYLNPSYINKGNAAKEQNKEGKWVYQVAFGVYQFFGAEGVAAKLNRNVGHITKVSKHNQNQVIHHGEECAIQNNDYFADLVSIFGSTSNQPVSEPVPSTTTSFKPRSQLKFKPDRLTKPIGDKRKAGIPDRLTKPIGDKRKAEKPIEKSAKRTKSGLIAGFFKKITDKDIDKCSSQARTENVDDESDHNDFTETRRSARILSKIKDKGIPETETIERSSQAGTNNVKINKRSSPAGTSIDRTNSKVDFIVKLDPRSVSPDVCSPQEQQLGPATGDNSLQQDLKRAEEKIQALEELSGKLHEAFQRTVKHAQWGHSALRNATRIFNHEDGGSVGDSKTRKEKREVWKQKVKAKSFDLHGVLQGIIEPANVAVCKYVEMEPAAAKMFVHEKRVEVLIQDEDAA